MMASVFEAIASLHNGYYVTIPDLEGSKVRRREAGITAAADDCATRLPGWPTRKARQCSMGYGPPPTTARQWPTTRATKQL